MTNKENFQYDLVEKLSFRRYGGTEEELKAAEIILEEIEKAGGKGELMEFQIPAFDCSVCKVTFNGQEMDSVPYGFSGQTAAGGQDYKRVYIEDADEANFLGNKDLSGCCALVNQLDLDMFKKLLEHKASAFAAISGKYFETDETTDLVPRTLRPQMLTFGKIPGVAIRGKDALTLLKAKEEAAGKGEDVYLHIDLQQTETTHTSRDVLAVIEGTENKEESIVITGHYDSVLVGTGSWDNATGSAMLNMLYNHFLENPPKRTLRFVWCGSEEQGLYGSINYVKQHMDIMEQIRFCFNFDMNGTLFGPNLGFITGGEDLEHWYMQAAMEYGYATKSRTLIHSSDSAPFALKDIPSIGLSRGGTGIMEIHTRNDLMPVLSAAEMYKNYEFAAYLIGRFVNAAMLPIERKLSDDMKKKAQEYFKLDKAPDYKVFD